MTKWLADYEVESYLSVAKKDLRIKFRHPNDLYEIHFKNLDIKPLVEKPLLSVQVIFDCDEIDRVAEKSREYLKLFLNVLSFITNAKHSIHRIVCIVDWTPGLEMRDCQQFLTSPDPNRPVPLLDDNILESVNRLMGNDISDDLRRALRWFSLGIGANYTEEQFEYFWFALEVLAEQDKKPDKVPDKCPKCKSPLYCDTCKETPMHRPYPKQAIEQLIKRVVKQKPGELYELLSKVRHALLHGDDIDDIEKSLPVSLSHLVDVLGQTVWTALLNSLKSPHERTSLAILKTNTYGHRKLVTTSILKVGSGSSKDEPQIEKIPLVEVELSVHSVHDEQDKGDID
jgi:hypothetical protein